MSVTPIMNGKVDYALENTRFLNYKFDGIIFQSNLTADNEPAPLRMRHVTFKDCNFTRTDFVDVQTPNTKFENCRFKNVKFLRTDLRGENDAKFVGCIFISTKVEEVYFIIKYKIIHIKHRAKNAHHLMMSAVMPLSGSIWSLYLAQ